MEKFTVLKEYLKSISLGSPCTPDIFFSTAEGKSMLAINVDTRAASAGENIYEVILAVNLCPKMDEKEIFNISCEYASIISLNGTYEEVELKHILMVEVPAMLYSIMRHFLSVITHHSGFPPIYIQYFDFEDKFKEKLKGLDDFQIVESTAKDDEKEEEDDFVCVDDEEDEDVNVEDDDDEEDEDEEDEEEDDTNFVDGPLSYESHVEGLCDTEEGKEFWKVCVENGMDPDLIFEHTPMYKYLMTFVDIPDYTMPDGIGNYDSFMNLFHLVVFNDKAQWRFEEDGDDLLFKVTYPGVCDDEAVSDMDYDEVDLLLNSLVLDAWTEYNLKLSTLFPEENQKKADEYLKGLEVTDKPTLQEYKELFSKYAVPSYLSLVDINELYAKIEYINLKTVKYVYC